jgi:uncharacterized membrane protein
MKITDALISGVLLLAIDSTYLTAITEFFKEQIKDVQKSPLRVNMYGVVLSYLCLIIAINYFIIQRDASWVDAFVLGIVIYGVYEGTTFALLKDWKLSTVVIDTLWGGILFALVAILTKMIKDVIMR